MKYLLILILFAGCSKIKTEEYITLQTYSVDIQGRTPNEPPKMFYWIWQKSNNDYYIAHHSDFKKDIATLDFKSTNVFPEDIYRYGARLNDLTVKLIIITK